MSAQNLLFGIGLTLFVNVLLVTNSFLVGRLKLVASEICFVKSFLQILLFTSVLIVQKLTKPSQQQPQQQHWKNLVLWVLIYSVSMGTMTMTAYIGVKMIPIGDFVVFGHTSSVFTLLFSACFLKEKITLLKSFLCLTVVAGVVLVVQPSFLFSEEVNPKSNYWIGVATSFLCAASAGLANVASARCRGCSLSILMVASGFGTVVVAVLAVLASENSYLPVVTHWTRALITTGVAGTSIAAGLTLIVANQAAPPTVIAVVRATEILLALLADKVLISQEAADDEGLISTVLHSVGAAIVLASIVFMAAAEPIQSKLEEYCSKTNTMSEESK